ncbi:hypothetical protein F5141DRAFT_1065084 [Pisolithus sp. B1]|nr:hypothetical protein F5141DRAFT_1065084 [Pisolithus sp. B1]
MPPTTSPQNKTKHPGLLDLPVVAPEATGPPGSRLQAKQKAKSKPEWDTITRQVAALKVDLLTQQQARASAHQPPGPPQDKQPCAWSTMYRTKVSSGLEVTKVVIERLGSDNQQVVRSQRPSMKGKTTVGARSQVVTGSNAMEQIVAHTGFNPEAATTVDNDTTGVDNDLDEENPGKIVSKTQQMAPDVNAIGKEVKGVTTRMVVDNKKGRHMECTRPSMVSQLNRKGNSLHEPMSHSPRSLFPVIGLVPNWCSTKVHLGVPTQSQPNLKTSNSKARSQHHTDGSTSNPDGAPQDGYKSLYGGLNDGDDANNTCTQVLYTSAFHLTPNSEPTLPLLHLKKPGSFSSGCANVESEHGYLTIDKHRVGSGDGDHDYHGYRGDNVGSDQDECSDDNDNSDNNDNGSGNNGDAPALTCTTSHAVEQSGLDARAFKKGPSNSFKPVVTVFNHSLTCKVPSMEQPSQQVQKPGPSQNWASSALSCMQGHSHHAVEADKENFEKSLPWKLANPLHVAYVQKVWAKTFPNIKSNNAVKAFFDWYEEVDTTEAQAAYVAWAVLEVTEIVDAHGHMKPVAPSLFPYMWERVDEGPDSPIPKGTFQHDCILDTFTFYLESTSIIKSSARENPACFPQCALTLATIAVERAFLVWSMGQYVPLPKAQQRFSQALWGYGTNEVMKSVDCLSAKQWKRILLGAEKYVGAYRPQPTLDVLVAKLRKLSGRATCFEPDCG